MNMVWFTSVKLAEISDYVLKIIRLFARKPNSKNHSWTNEHRINWNEAFILATGNHKFSCKMKESQCDRSGR